MSVGLVLGRGGGGNEVAVLTNRQGPEEFAMNVYWRSWLAKRREEFTQLAVVTALAQTSQAHMRLTVPSTDLQPRFHS